MGDVSKGEGRTVLFVSHNLSSVKELCSQGILLEKGNSIFKGDINQCLLQYQKKNDKLSTYKKSDEDITFGNAKIKVLSFSATPIFDTFISVKSGVRIEIIFLNNVTSGSLDISFLLKTVEEITIFSTGVLIAAKEDVKRRTYTVSFDLPPHLLNENQYYFDLFWGHNRKEILYRFENFGFEVLNNENEYGVVAKSPGILSPKLKYSIK